MKPRISPLAVSALLAVVALVALLAYGVASNEPTRAIDEAVARGKPYPAPELELPRLSGGGRAALSDYRGKVVVLNIWASWCEPCKAESPLLERWHKRMEKDGGLVLGIDTLDVTSDALDFIDEYGLTYPMLRDRDGDAIRALGVVAYPETFVIDRQGRIVATERGPVDDAFMRENVLPLLRS